MSYYHFMLLINALAVATAFAILWGTGMLLHWIGIFHV